MKDFICTTAPLPKVIGLTGGIGSGKSTVSKRLRELGCCVIDADLLAREVVAPGSPGLSAIVERFTSEILTPQGGLDREKLRRRIFKDPQLRQRLNAIVHPLIDELRGRRVLQAGAQGFQWVVYDAALLVETQLYRRLDAVVVVTLSPEIQIQRVMQRDGLTAMEVERIVAAQMPLSKKVAVADYVIDNSGTLEQTLQQVEELLQMLKQEFGEFK